MSERVIEVRGLSKTYRVPEREAGLGAAVRSLVHRRVREVRAVEGVSFGLEAGEMAALLGPNGAGKTTTLKVLAGLMRPPPARCAWPATCPGNGAPNTCGA